MQNECKNFEDCLSGEPITNFMAYRKALREAKLAASNVKAPTVQQPAPDDIWMNDCMNEQSSDDESQGEIEDNPFTEELASYMHTGYDSEDDYIDQNTSDGPELSAKGWTSDKILFVEQVTILGFLKSLQSTHKVRKLSIKGRLKFLGRAPTQDCMGPGPNATGCINKCKFRCTSCDSKFPFCTIISRLLNSPFFKMNHCYARLVILSLTMHLFYCTVYWNIVRDGGGRTLYWLHVHHLFVVSNI